MFGRRRSRATVLAIVAVVVALSAFLVLGGRPTVHPGVVHQITSESTPDRLLNGFTGTVDVGDVAVPDAARVPVAGTASFELWALPACLAALLALAVFRRRDDTASGPATQLWWIGTRSLRAPPGLLHV